MLRGGRYRDSISAGGGASKLKSKGGTRAERSPNALTGELETDSKWPSACRRLCSASLDGIGSGLSSGFGCAAWP